MDASGRLRLLFEGEDESLLHTRVGGLQPLPQVANADRPATAPQEKPAQQDDSDDDPIFKDEYLACFARADKEAERKRSSNKNKNKKQQAKSTAAMKPSAAVPMADAILQSQKGPQDPLDDSQIRYFCPIVAISRFPYKYVRGPDSNLIAQGFFDGGKFWERTWDLYYIHPPSDISLSPLLLVPMKLVQDLLDEINKSFRTNLAIPSRPDLGILLPFEKDGTPQPEFLGTSTSREMKDALERSIPSGSGDVTPPPGCAYEVDRSFAAFKAKIEAAVESTRRRSKAARAKKQQEQAVKVRDWCRSLKRVECYLGFRQRLRRETRLGADAAKEMSRDAQQQPTHEHAVGTASLPLDVDQPAPFPFADEPIFICVDVESNEKRHEQITEIGISTLDTLDLVGIPPGPGGSSWMGYIRSRHFRISEYAHVVNHNYIMGCPGSFEFGESEWISMKDAADIVDSCFVPPYSADKCADLNTTVPLKQQARSQDTGATTQSSEAVTKKPSAASVTSQSSGGIDVSTDNVAPAKPIREHKKRARKLILVGHDVSSDISYMSKLGCKVLAENTSGNASKDPKNQPVFLETVDTSTLFRVLKRETQASSLAKVLVELGLVGWNLHNAGNDACYTMEAMIGIALNSRLQDGLNAEPITAPVRESTAKPDPRLEKTTQSTSTTGRNAWQAEVDRRAATQAQETAARVREECALWDSVLGVRGDWDVANDDLDGGIATGITFNDGNGASGSKN